MASYELKSLLDDFRQPVRDARTRIHLADAASGVEPGENRAKAALLGVVTRRPSPTSRPQNPRFRQRYCALSVGYRMSYFGIRAGTRLHASAFRVGDLAATNTGIPLPAQLEFRRNEHYPFIVQAWGFSPFGDEEGLGARLFVPLGGNAYFTAETELAKPTINVRGRYVDDRILVGRHESLLTAFSLSMQL